MYTSTQITYTRNSINYDILYRKSFLYKYFYHRLTSKCQRQIDFFVIASIPNLDVSSQLYFYYLEMKIFEKLPAFSADTAV